MATKVTELLNAAGIAYEIYDGIKPNPTIENERLVLRLVRRLAPMLLLLLVAVAQSIQVRQLLLLLRTLSSPMYAALKAGRLLRILAANHRCSTIIWYGEQRYY